MKPDTADVIWEIGVSWSPAWPMDDIVDSPIRAL